MQTPDNEQLTEALGGENAEFTAKASRTCMPGQTVSLFVLGIFLLFIGTAAILALLSPFFFASKLGAGANWARFAPLLVITPLLGLLVLGGLFSIGIGLYRLLAPGSWFVGTPTRLIMLRKNRQRSVGWNEFSGEIDSQKMGEKIALTLTLRSGRTVRYGHRRASIVPRRICLAGIEDGARIERIIQGKISASQPGLSD